MGGALSNFFQSGHALLSSSHNRQVSEQTKRNIRIIFDALRANPKVRSVSVVCLERGRYFNWFFSSDDSAEARWFAVVDPEE